MSKYRESPSPLFTRLASIETDLVNRRISIKDKSKSPLKKQESIPLLTEVVELEPVKEKEAFASRLKRLCEKIYMLNDMAKPMLSKKPPWVRRESIIQKFDHAAFQ